MDARWIAGLQDPDPARRRQAILALGRSADVADRRVLEVLERVYRSDPDPTLRELARQTARQVWARTAPPAGTTPPAAEPQPSQPAPAQPGPAVALKPPPEEAHPPIHPRVAQASAKALDLALSLHLRRDRAGALQALRRALQLNPALAGNTLAMNLASELTGLPAEEAVDRLLEEQTARALVERAHVERERSPISSRLIFTSVLLVLGLVLLAAASVWFVRAGFADSYAQAFERARLRGAQQTYRGYDYYLIIPSGSPPPGGWPVLVALHGNGGEAGHMLPAAGPVTDAGAIFVAPTFGTYDPQPEGPLGVLDGILAEVAERYPLDNRGAVLLGLSQGGAFAYRFSVRYPARVAGVVTAGAPRLDPIAPASVNIPYLFTWGENDWLIEYILPTVQNLAGRGYNVRYAIVPGAGHELTPYAIEQAIRMLGSD